MKFRPPPTTTVAIAFLIASATIPLRDAFGDWGWTLGVIGASIVGAGAASALETLRPKLPLAALCAITALSATVWTLMVTLRDSFWSSPGPTDAMRSFVDGVFGGWGALLDNQVPITDPQRAEVFVTCLVWVVAAASIHVAARGRTAFAAIGGGAVILAVSAAAALPEGIAPAVIGIGAGAGSLIAIATLTRATDQAWRLGRMAAIGAVVVGAGAIALLVGLGASGLDRTPADPRSARDVETVAVPVPDLLAEYSARRIEGDTVLTVISDAPPAGLRLRLQVYDVHDGERWLPSASFQEFAAFPPPTGIPAGEPVEVAVRLDALDGPWIPVPDRVTDLDLDDIRWNEDAQTVVRDSPPTQYRVSGTLVGRTDLDGIDAARDGIDPSLSQAPAGFPDSIRQVALDTTAEANDAISAIDAVTARLRTLGRDESRPPGNSFGRLRDDLAAGEPTGAEQIASLHALMLRSIGIPSRVVVGYLANSAEVESDDLQVWVEAAFAGTGWVVIDAVPPVTETSADPTEQTATPTTAPERDAPLQAQALPRDLGPGADPDEAEIGTDRELTRTGVALIGLGLLLAAVFGLIAARITRRRMRKNEPRPERRVIGAWAEFVDRLRELGAPISSTTTTGDVVFMAAAIDPELGDHAEALAGLASGALHAPHDSDPDQAAEAWQSLRLAEARITDLRGRSVVPRRYLDPRVLRYRAPRPPESREANARARVREPSPSA